MLAMGACTGTTGLALCPHAVAPATTTTATVFPRSVCRFQMSCKNNANIDPVRFHPFQKHSHSQGRLPIHIAFDSLDSSHTGDTSEDSMHSLVPLANSAAFQPLSKDMAMGLVLKAATGGGWTTDSGLEGPAFSDVSKDTTDPLNTTNKWPQLSNSPRRRMRVAFTCNVCGERTMRAINPHAYTDGTVFVQCKGCNVFHKLVDNLNLFYEWDGRLYLNKSSALPTAKVFKIMQSDDEIPGEWRM